LFPKGTYKLGSAMQVSDLRSSLMQIPSSVLEDKLQQYISPHDSVEGWAAFDIVETSTEVINKRFKIEIVDSAGETSSLVVKNPVPSEGEYDTSRAYLQPVGDVVDLSDSYIKYYKEPVKPKQ